MPSIIELAWHITSTLYAGAREREIDDLIAGSNRYVRARHWKATMEYHKTKDILHVQQLLGHRNIKNTLLYTQLVTLTDDEYVCKVARTPKETQDLIENSFEYICDQDDLKFFRKRK